jgi:hypothetical protein
MARSIVFRPLGRNGCALLTLTSNVLYGLLLVCKQSEFRP